VPRIDGGLRGLFRERIPEAHWQSIETGLTGRGVPDSNYCIPAWGPAGERHAKEGWIEFKKCTSRKIGLRPEQVAWISRRARVGGRVLVAVRLQHDGGPRKGDPVDELWLLEGGGVLDMAQRGLVENAVWVLHRSGGGPAAWDWGRVVQILQR
jgi:hypothetical protein